MRRMEWAGAELTIIAFAVCIYCLASVHVEHTFAYHSAADFTFRAADFTFRTILHPIAALAVAAAVAALVEAAAVDAAAAPMARRSPR